MIKEDVKPGEIYYSTNYDVLKQVINKTDEIKKNDLLKEDFAMRIGKYLINKTGMVMVSFDKDKALTGCMVVSKQRDNLGEYLWIDFAWISPKHTDLGQKFQDEIMDGCRKRGIKRIQARMSKGFKAMEKIYGAYEIAKILEKEVT